LVELTGNDSLRAELGAAARLRVEQQFSWPTVASKHLDAFETLLAGKARPSTDADRSES
jgi:glycosyltransferase involved in cell wall biosynthesis